MQACAQNAHINNGHVSEENGFDSSTENGVCNGVKNGISHGNGNIDGNDIKVCLLSCLVFLIPNAFLYNNKFLPLNKPLPPSLLNKNP